MQVIKQLSEYIEDELHDAEKYLNAAFEYKDKRPNLAQVFYALAEGEMEHMTNLHKSVVEIIENYRKEKGEPPAAMQAVYDYLHQKHIDKAAKIKTMQAMFKR